MLRLLGVTLCGRWISPLLSGLRKSPGPWSLILHYWQLPLASAMLHCGLHLTQVEPFCLQFLTAHLHPPLQRSQFTWPLHVAAASGLDCSHPPGMINASHDQTYCHTAALRLACWSPLHHFSFALSCPSVEPRRSLVPVPKLPPTATPVSFPLPPPPPLSGDLG